MRASMRLTPARSGSSSRCSSAEIVCSRRKGRAAGEAGRAPDGRRRRGRRKQFHRAGVAEGRLTEVRGGERLSCGVEHASGAGQIVAAEAGGGSQDFVGIAWQRREGIGGEDDPALGAHEAVEEAFACLAGRQEVEVDEGNGAVAGRQLEPQLSADGLPLVGRAMLGENREVVGGHFAERGAPASEPK